MMSREALKVDINQSTNEKVSELRTAGYLIKNDDALYRDTTEGSGDTYVVKGKYLRTSFNIAKKAKETELGLPLSRAQQIQLLREVLKKELDIKTEGDIEALKHFPQNLYYFINVSIFSFLDDEKSAKGSVLKALGIIITDDGQKPTIVIKPNPANPNSPILDITMTISSLKSASPTSLGLKIPFNAKVHYQAKYNDRHNCYKVDADSFIVTGLDRAIIKEMLMDTLSDDNEMTLVTRYVQQKIIDAKGAPVELEPSLAPVLANHYYQRIVNAKTLSELEQIQETLIFFNTRWNDFSKLMHNNPSLHNKLISTLDSVAYNGRNLNAKVRSGAIRYKKYHVLHKIK
jgi:hypothetical protein